MNPSKLIKIFFYIISLNLLISCGYQPLLNEGNQKYSIIKFTLDGNKRLGSLLKGNLITTLKEENSIILNIRSTKKTNVADKSISGKILTYELILNFELNGKDKNDNILFSKVYTKKQTYGASNIYLNTINNEKKVVENLIETVASEIQIDLNAVYQAK